MALDPKKIQTLIKLLTELAEELEEAEEEEEEEEEAPPKRGRAKAPAKKSKTVEPEEEEEEEEEPDDDAPTLNELRALAVKASKKATDGKEKVLAALQKHGTERLTEVNESKYSDLKEMLDKIIEDDDYDPRAKAKAAKKKTKSDDF